MSYVWELGVTFIVAVEIPGPLPIVKALFVPRGGTPYDSLHGEAPPERGTFFRLQVYERVGKQCITS